MVQPSPGSSTIELPSAFAESGAYPHDRPLTGSPQQCSLALACRHPPEGHQIGARKRRTPGNAILSQPYRRRVSTDRLNREGNQLAASLQGEPGPTPAGKTVPHSYPETRFRRERALKVVVLNRFPDGSNLGLLYLYSVCVAIPFILDVRLFGRTSRGHTGGRSHRISLIHLHFAVLALIFLSRRIQPFLFPRRPVRLFFFCEEKSQLV